MMQIFFFFWNKYSLNEWLFEKKNFRKTFKKFIIHENIITALNNKKQTIKKMYEVFIFIFIFFKH